MNSRFVPATGLRMLLPLYDPAVALLTCERTVKRHLIDEARLESGLDVLDVGCGTGTLPLAAVAAAPSIRMMALDVDEKILAQARSKTNSARVTWKLGRATDIPCQSSSVDRVFCSLVMHHLDQDEKIEAMQEIARVMRPAGQLLLADYCRPANWLARLQFWPVRVLDGWSQTLDNVGGRLPKLMSLAGFGIVEETLAVATPLGTIRCYRAMSGG